MTAVDIQWLDDETIKVSGVIDANADFVGMVSKFPKKVTIDLSGVTKINSSGVRQWINAILSTSSKITYVKCPVDIIDQVSMIPEFLGKNASVESFEINFTCPNCGTNVSEYLTVGKDLQPGQDHYDYDPVRSCPTCQSEMEFDHNPQIYFHFLSDLK